MTMTREDLRIALSREELDYPALAAALSAAEIPLVREFAMGDDAMLATKAVYLASLIDADAAVDIVDVAARSPTEVVRIAAASALVNLPETRRSEIALGLLDDPSLDIKKLTLIAVERPTPALQAKIRALATRTGVERLRELAEERLRVPD